MWASVCVCVCRFAQMKSVSNGEVSSHRAATLPANSSLEEQSLTSPPMQEIGLHTVQLLPIVITGRWSLSGMGGANISL